MAPGVLERHASVAGSSAGPARSLPAGLGPTSLGDVVAVEPDRVTPDSRRPSLAIACAIIASSRWAAANCPPLSARRRVATSAASSSRLRSSGRTTRAYRASRFRRTASSAVPAAPAGVRGWGRDGLGTGARGRGARARRALMLPSLPIAHRRLSCQFTSTRPANVPDPYPNEFTLPPGEPQDRVLKCWSMPTKDAAEMRTGREF